MGAEVHNAGSQRLQSGPRILFSQRPEALSDLANVPLNRLHCAMKSTELFLVYLTAILYCICHRSSNVKMNLKKKIGKDVEISGRGLF
jgi:hypothetical protein